MIQQEKIDKFNSTFGFVYKELHPDANSNIVHEHWTHFAPLSNTWHIIFGTFVTIAGLCGFLCNLLVLSLFLRYKTFRQSSNIFILNLAIADFTLVITNYPFMSISNFVGHWCFGEIGCKLFAFLGALSSFLSMNTLTAIAFERCIVIVFRLPWYKKTSSKSVSLIICFVWAYSTLWSIGPLLGWGNYILEGSLTSCTFDFFTRTKTNKSFVISILVSCFFVQLLFIILSYLSIFIKVVLHERELKHMSGTRNGRMFSLRNSKRRKNEKCEIKTAKVALCIIVVFCASWFPYAIVCMIGMFGRSELISPLVSSLPGLCAKTATVINPMIYALLHPKFRCKLSRVCFKTKTKYAVTKHHCLMLSTKGSDLCDSAAEGTYLKRPMVHSNVCYNRSDNIEGPKETCI